MDRRPQLECSVSVLSADALAKVFSHLPFQDRLMAVPLGCKSWREASSDPTCWRSVDMQPWFEKRAEEDYSWEYECEPKMEFLIEKVVDRSCGQLQELRTTQCSDSAAEYIAENSPKLQVLSIPDSALVSDESAMKVALNCPKLQVLDVSDCYNISSLSLEAFGRNCKSLSWLGRNMLHKHLFETAPGTIPGGDDEEAIVMSMYMANLKHLEMKKATISNVGVRNLARGCSKLESLNLAACSGLSAKALDDLTRACPNLREFTKPIVSRMNVNSKNLPTTLLPSGTV